jgi:hypothetical protein
MASALCKTFALDTSEALMAADSWVYGQVFLVEGRRYRVAHYYLAGDEELQVTVTLEPISDRRETPIVNRL